MHTSLDNKSTIQETQKTNYPALSTLTTVFFFWGFIAAGNGILIPFCKDHFALDQFQSQLIDFAFYFAYFIGGLVLFIFGAGFRKDFIGIWGYKKSIVIGLLISALGSLLIISAVGMNSYNGMLIGWFILAAGFSIQQTAANPFMISLGDERSGAVRINFGGAINSLGTTIGPLIVSYLLFGAINASAEEKEKLSITSVNTLYASVCVLFLLSACLFVFFKSVPAGKLDATNSKLGNAKKAITTLLIMTGSIALSLGVVMKSYTSTDQKQVESLEKSMKNFDLQATKQTKALRLSEVKSAYFSDSLKKTSNYLRLKDLNSSIKKRLDRGRLPWLTFGIIASIVCIVGGNLLARRNAEGWGALKYPQVSLGMLAIFAYVGVEVAIGSNLSEFVKSKEILGVSESEAASFVAMYWGSLMIGRWTGAVSIFNLSSRIKMLLKAIVPLFTLGLILLIFYLKGETISYFSWYFLCVFIQIGASIFTRDRPAMTIKVFAGLGVLSLLLGLYFTGIVSVYCFLSAGLFCSMLWPCIFSLSLSGTGNFQAQGSALLIMMILGGALIPPFQGKLADIVGIHNSFITGVFCFVYIVFFGFFANAYLKKHSGSLDD